MKCFKTLIVISLLLITACSSDANSEGVQPTPGSGSGSTSSTTFELEIMKLINNHRAGKGLVKLEILDVIKSQTDKHTDYMINAGKISHDRFSERGDYLKKNANAKGVAENVASGYTTAESVVNGWINSEGHRKNIEGNYTHFNLTAKQNSSKKWYYTNIFVRK